MKVLLKINKALEENEFFDTGWQAHRVYKTAGASAMEKPTVKIFNTFKFHVLPYIFEILTSPKKYIFTFCAQWNYFFSVLKT